MKIIVYVEGPSDRDGLSALFREILEDRELSGTKIEFSPANRGDRKVWLLTHAIVSAVNILRNDENTKVAIVPDLYPPNKAFPHETAGQLVTGIRNAFDHEVRSRGADPRIVSRFAAFCFKHEFEVLLLAAEDALRAHLKCQSFKCDWKRPPEDQDHGNPPKRVVKELFRAHGAFYDDVLTPAGILRNASVRQLREACPQCFAALADFIENP